MIWPSGSAVSVENRDIGGETLHQGSSHLTGIALDSNHPIERHHPHQQKIRATLLRIWIRIAAREHARKEVRNG